LQEKNATKKEEDKSYKYSQADIDRLQNVYWAAMNLLGIEEHIFFTAMKAENDDDRNDWMAIHEKVRKMRSKLLKIMLEGHVEQESWCTAKHILGAAMRLHEAAYKYEGELRKELTEYANFVYDLFYVMQETVKKHEMKNKKMRK